MSAHRLQGRSQRRTCPYRNDSRTARYTRRAKPGWSDTTYAYRTYPEQLSSTFWTSFWMWASLQLTNEDADERVTRKAEDRKQTAARRRGQQYSMPAFIPTAAARRMKPSIPVGVRRSTMSVVAAQKWRRPTGYTGTRRRFDGRVSGRR